MSQPETMVDMDEALREANERADRAEQEVARLKGHAESPETVETTGDGVAELRKDSMMAHLLDSLEAGKDIGHYGRLVFAMVARHFMSHQDVLAWLSRDPDLEEADAVNMLRQVEGRDYNPPKRDRLLEWQIATEVSNSPPSRRPGLRQSLPKPKISRHHLQPHQSLPGAKGQCRVDPRTPQVTLTVRTAQQL